MVRKEIKELVRFLRRDERYRRLKNLFDTSPIYRLSIEQLGEEVMALHKTRPIRRLNAMDPKIVDSVVNALTTDQSNRSRLTEISITCMSAQTSLQQAIDSLRYHLVSTYQDELRQFRTKDERMMVIDMTFTQFERYITKVSILKAKADQVIVDIDKGGWALRTLADVLKIHHGREMQL